ncbi:hypothetical protein MRB53_000992 [Persea americana]|uniref:Uncharacterized protein n=1 Tax=Persea americana TaxID=3435 RepID=A0ACC2MRG9_PERAE|nr:hypothetical protein MRB53_000992 [Persea americana]|eukprot:TRINITY_DN6731_c0_g1_i1.p1 TRINITY_DN6731_c0_g1~~TRINITY_DN6731_c0_g1_i1.p1  ORF type:complete len:349 (+),score=90.32 TRINITY_DN6731_c0_g1_i1:233-1279(+)
METPSSMRRVTRSQTLSASNNMPMSRKKEEPGKVISRSTKGKIQDRSALFDITNDSPIVGLAMGSLKTPSSVDKDRDGAKQMPATGEVLLRGQVKILLQKIEEDSDLPKLSFNQPPFPQFQGLLSSPAAAFLAPTPANTPSMSNLSNGNTAVEINGSPAVISVAEEQDPNITQVTHDLQQETLESSESPITRALLFDDSPGKSEISDSSTLSSELTSQGSCYNEKSDVDDNASVWSIQVNASSQGDVEDPEEVMGEVEDYEEEEMGEVDDGGLIDELCAGMEKVCVQEKGGMAEFKGRHTRFIYNSDDEIEGEEEATEDSSASPSVLCLKGMPMPEGKHLRFPEEDED